MKSTTNGFNDTLGIVLVLGADSFLASGRTGGAELGQQSPDWRAAFRSQCIRLEDLR
jgi:hypothetical protein